MQVWEINGRNGRYGERIVRERRWNCIIGIRWCWEEEGGMIDRITIIFKILILINQYNSYSY